MPQALRPSLRISTCYIVSGGFKAFYGSIPFVTNVRRLEGVNPYDVLEARYRGDDLLNSL